MGRVRRIHLLRQIAHPTLRVGGVIAAFFLIFQSVSISNIVSNALNTSSLTGFLNFSLRAVTDTEPMIQLLLFVGLALGFWVVYEEIEKKRILREMGI